jgi:hypothetical protein
MQATMKWWVLQVTVFHVQLIFFLQVAIAEGTTACQGMSAVLPTACDKKS